MNILTVNIGSTSGKLGLYLAHDLSLRKESNFSFSSRATEEQKKSIIHKHLGKFSDDVAIVVHRIVHGGPEFTEPTLLTKRVQTRLRQFDFLAPLHNPINRLGIEESQRRFSRIPHVGVFDTQFHRTIPTVQKTYALPLAIRKRFHIQRYGFHGLSHEGVLNLIAKKLQKPQKQLNILSFHLGGGSSVTAIKNGTSFATTMGLSPNSGLIMMSRPGDIDSAIPLLLQKSGYSAEAIEHILNDMSGIMALAGTKDFRKLLERVAAENDAALLAYRLFIESIRKYAAYYATLLPRIDALGFTGAIGFGSAKVRRDILSIPFFKNVPSFFFPSQEGIMMAHHGRQMLEKQQKI